jgi:hypothetical protein
MKLITKKKVIAEKRASVNVKGGISGTIKSKA